MCAIMMVVDKRGGEEVGDQGGSVLPLAVQERHASTKTGLSFILLIFSMFTYMFPNISTRSAGGSTVRARASMGSKVLPQKAVKDILPSQQFNSGNISIQCSF
jgi:hypothetical protein